MFPSFRFRVKWKCFYVMPIFATTFMTYCTQEDEVQDFVCWHVRHVPPEMLFLLFLPWRWRLEGWKDGRMEGWKDGRMEGWNGMRSFLGCILRLWICRRQRLGEHGKKLRQPMTEVDRQRLWRFWVSRNIQSSCRDTGILLNPHVQKVGCRRSMTFSGFVWNLHWPSAFVSDVVQENSDKRHWW